MKPKFFEGVPDHDNWAVGPCETPEIAKEVLRIAHEKSGGDLKWYEGQSFLDETNWEAYEDQTFYLLLKGGFLSSFETEFSSHYEFHVLIPPADFIKANGGVVPLSPAQYWKFRCELAEDRMRESPFAYSREEAEAAYHDFIKTHKEPK